MSTNYLVVDLPRILSHEIGDDITIYRVRLAMHRWGIKAKRGEAVEVDDVIAKRAMAECPDLFTTSSSPKKKVKAGGEK